MARIIADIKETYLELFSRKQFWIWLVAFLILKAVDFSFTAWAVSTYGVEGELNPLAAWFFRQFGLPLGMTMFGVIMVGFFTFIFIYACHRHFPKIKYFWGKTWWFFWAVNGVFFIVAADWIHFFFTL
jgi:hypothetical protein